MPLAPDGPWKTVDDYLPMLKYGTQLPAPTASPAKAMPATQLPLSDSPRVNATGTRVAIVDVDVPFVSLLKLTFKWMAAGAIVGLCLFPVLLILVFIAMALFGGLVSHLFSGFPRP